MKKFRKRSMSGGAFTDKVVRSEQSEMPTNVKEIPTATQVKETSTVTQVEVPDTSAVLVPNVVITKAVEQNTDRKVSLKELLIENKWWIATAIAIAYYATREDEAKNG